MQSREIRTYIHLLTLVLVVFASTGCLSRQRFSNYGWQLDSLKYYTRRLDSLLLVQSTEIAQLSTDLYTKTNELSQKFDMLNSRLGESETQITQLYSKINPSQRALADSEAIAQVSPETRLLYESAYKNYVKGNYQQAIDGFGAYQKAAHDGPLVDNALYWIGESHAALGQLQRAVNALQELVSKYPNSPRVPTALYRMGIIYEEAKDQKSAKYYYNQVIRDFPNSPEAALARSKLQ
ncbi:MAG: tol-pal system protein YbgF [candidate division WOR-3 bacterium]|nr:MAG: tol-pal system protein YbgF [candidate division WOR-3 bacterium]